MALLRSFARRLAQTGFGQNVLTKPDGFSDMELRPGPRVYVGLLLLAMSYLIGLPALAYLSFLAVKLSQPMIIAGGGPVVFLLVHSMFVLGVYLGGKNYAVEMLHWATKRFLQKFA